MAEFVCEKMGVFCYRPGCTFSANGICKAESPTNGESSGSDKHARHPLVQRWLDGGMDAGGTIAELERELAAVTMERDHDRECAARWKKERDELAAPSAERSSLPWVPEGWLMWTSGDGTMQRICFTPDKVRTFIAEAMFGTVKDADDLVVADVMASFEDGDEWAGEQWRMAFEDGSINALRLALTSESAPSSSELRSDLSVELQKRARPFTPTEPNAAPQAPCTYDEASPVASAHKVAAPHAAPAAAAPGSTVEDERAREHLVPAQPAGAAPFDVSHAATSVVEELIRASESFVNLAMGGRTSLREDAPRQVRNAIAAAKAALENTPIAASATRGRE